MSSVVRILAAKGTAPVRHATIDVPATSDGVGDTLAFRGPDGSAGTVVLPPAYTAGQTVPLVVPSAYPNWQAGPDAYAGDWVAGYGERGCTYATDRGSWAHSQPLPRLRADPSYALRRGKLDAGQVLDPAAAAHREAAVRRNATQTAAARTTLRLAAATGLVKDSRGGVAAATAAAAGLESAAADAAQAHARASASAPSARGGIAVPCGPSLASVGNPEAVAASVRRLEAATTPLARQRCVGELRFLCRQNERAVEHKYQSAAGQAGALEQLSALLMSGDDAIDVAAEQQQQQQQQQQHAVLRLLSQLCFRHRSNCKRLLSARCSGIIDAAVSCVEAEPAVGGAAGLVLRESDAAGLRAASMALLCNLASNAPEGQGLRIAEAGGGVRAAVAVLRALEHSGIMSHLQPQPAEVSSDEEDEVVSGATASARDDEGHPAVAYRSVRAPLPTAAARGGDIPLPGPLAINTELVVPTLTLLEILAHRPERGCASLMARSGAMALLRPLTLLAGLFTGQVQQQRVPVAGSSVGAIAARTLSRLISLGVEAT